MYFSVKVQYNIIPTCVFFTLEQLHYFTPAGGGFATATNEKKSLRGRECYVYFEENATFTLKKAEGHSVYVRIPTCNPCLSSKAWISFSYSVAAKCFHLHVALLSTDIKPATYIVYTVCMQRSQVWYTEG